MGGSEQHRYPQMIPQQQTQQDQTHSYLQPANYHHSIASTALAFEPGDASSSYARPQKRTRARNRPPLGSSSGTGDSDSDSDFDNPAQHGYTTLPTYDDKRYTQTGANSTRQPPRKRPHLDQDDVGRFADMSILEDHQQQMPSTSTSAPHLAGHTHSRGRTLHRISKSPPVQSQPRAPPASPAPSDRLRLSSANMMLSMTPTSPMSPVALEAPPATPFSEWDLPMHPTKPPSSWDIDRYTTYVHSLDDDDDDDATQDDGFSSSSSAIGQQQSPEQKATIPITCQEAEELQNSREAKPGPVDSSPYEIIPELLAKLEAHSKSVLIGGDMSRRRYSVPSREDAKNALVLWKGPDQLFGSDAKHGSDDEIRMQEPSFPSNGSFPPSMPLADGTRAADTSSKAMPIFAFGAPQTSDAPSPSFSPSFAPMKRGRGASRGNMSSTSTASSSMSVTPLGSPRLSSAHGGPGLGQQPPQVSSGMELDES